jgi:hypothetical protein
MDEPQLPFLTITLEPQPCDYPDVWSYQRAYLRWSMEEVMQEMRLALESHVSALTERLTCVEARVAQLEEPA